MRLPRAWLRAAGLAAARGHRGRVRQHRRRAGRPRRRPVPPAPRSAIPRSRPPLRSAQAAGLSPAQLAGQRVIYSYAGQTPARRAAVADPRTARWPGSSSSPATSPARPSWPGVIRQLDAADAAATNPVHAPLLLMTDQEGGPVRRLPGAPFQSEKQIGQSANPAAAAKAAGAGRRGQPARLGLNSTWRRCSTCSARPATSTTSSGGPTARPADGGHAGRRLHHGPAGGRGRRHGQALPRPGRGGHQAGHRQRAGHAERARGHAARRGRAALPGRHRRRGQADHAVLGGLPGAGPGPPGRPVGPDRPAASCAAGSASPASRSPTRWRPGAEVLRLPSRSARCSPHGPGWT